MESYLFDGIGIIFVWWDWNHICLVGVLNVLVASCACHMVDGLGYRGRAHVCTFIQSWYAFALMNVCYIYAACYVAITGIQGPSSCRHIYKSVIRYFRKQESHRFILWYAHCSSSVVDGTNRDCSQVVSILGWHVLEHRKSDATSSHVDCDRRRGFQTPRVPGVTCALVIFQ